MIKSGQKSRYYRQSGVNMLRPIEFCESAVMEKLMASLLSLRETERMLPVNFYLNPRNSHTLTKVIAQMRSIDVYYCDTKQDS